MLVATSALVAGALSFGLGLGCGGEKFTSATPVSGDDGGIEAGAADGAGDAALGYCEANASKHFFCDDWDSRTDPKGLWDAVGAGGSGSVLVDGTQSRSVPSSFVAKTIKTGSTDGTVAVLQKKLGRLKDFHVAFELFVEQYGSDQRPADKNPAVIANLALGSAVNFSFAIESPLSATFSETVTNDAGTPVSYPRQISGFETGKWVRVLIDLTPPTAVGGQGNVHITIDGTVVLNDHLNTPPLVGPDGTFVLGVLFAPGETAPNLWTIHFDNLTIDRAAFP